MNTKEIAIKIRYRRFEHLKSLSVVNFHLNAINENLYSNIDFLNYFKNGGWFFWQNVLMNTRIPFDILFDNFEKELGDDQLYNLMVDLLNLNLNKERKNDIADKTILICRGYFNAYKRHYLEY